MRIIDLALKDLSQILRDKRSLLFLVAMPILFTFFMGFAYKSGSSQDTPQDDRIPLGWVNQDGEGQVAQQLFEMLSISASVRLVELPPDGVETAVRQGDVAGALVVPADYSARAFSGDAAQLALVADLATAQGQSLFQLLKAPVSHLLSAVEIARLGSEALGKSGDPNEQSETFLAAYQAWSESETASLVRVEMAVADRSANWYGDNPYNQASPGILVQFAIMGLVTTGQILVQERKTHTLQRMASTSMQPWEIIAGHLLAMFSIVFLQIMLLVVFGQVVLGTQYGHEPLGTLLISAALGLWIAAMGMLIGTLAKDDSQVVLISLMAMFIFSALGGAWFPLEASSGAFAQVGRLLPSAWAMQGYQNILIRGLGLASTWLPAAILLLYALGFFTLAIWRFRKMAL